MEDQNGNGNTLRYRVGKVEEDVERIDKTVTSHGDRIIAVEKDVATIGKSGERIEKSLASTNSWLRGIAGALVVALIMLLINLISGFRPQLGHP